jgi:hypothetical protein
MAVFFAEDTVTIHPEAILGPSELDSLRAVAAGMGEGISALRANLLTDMGLIEIDSTGTLILTEAGRLRLGRAAPARPRSAPTRDITRPR